MKSRVATLQSIELAGFKSFAKRTKIEFGDGLVAIVGPNGSGKSNIADAIRWVFGEQKSRSLRTDKSEDLIYHGGNGKARASMAEVVIRLDNSARAISIDLNEVEITRRLYRSGESAYLLNGRKASLASIQEVLSASGFGVGSYTVIGQGMIDKLILSTGKDRKQLFEEASGIKQYEIKLMQTQKRINSAQQNLDEIKSIIANLAPEHELLTHQAKLFDKKNNLKKDIEQSKASYIHSELKIIDKAKADLLKQISENSENLSSIEKTIKALEKDNSITDTNLLNKQAEKINSELSKIEKQKELVETKILNLLSVIEERKQKLAEVDNSLLATKKDIAEYQSTLAEHVHEQKKIESELKKLDAKILIVDDKIQQQTKELEATRKHLVKSQRSEYLKHSLGLIDILEDGVKRSKSEDELNLIFYKLRRMIKHSIADNSAELAMKVGKIQNIITRLLDERESINESQTGEVIKLRAIEMDSASIDQKISELNKRLDALNKEKDNLSKRNSDKANTVELKSLERNRDNISKQITENRQQLVEIAQSSTDNNIDEYYRKHEELSNKKIMLSSEADRLLSNLKDLEAKELEINQTKNLWFPYKMPQIKSPKSIDMVAIGKLEAEMELLQEINPEVEKQVAESEKRMKYLQDQANDLERALKNLEGLSASTEAKMKAIFEKSFKKINQYFAKNFKTLFGGGQAELKLQNESEEYGVEILVKLPNKNSQNISSLSGGEKALASVALLSGILMSNPSPFVVLDEVDAALDEENTKRFADIITKITKHSQVLVVTHNHETMAVADELLGVTTSGNNESTIIKVQLSAYPTKLAK